MSKIYKCKYCDFETETPQKLGGHVLAVHKKENNNSSIIKNNNKYVYEQNPVYCKNCDIIIPYDKIRLNKSLKYCSLKCFHLSIDHNTIGERKTNFCLFCGKLIYHPKKYCNHSCFGNYKSMETIKNWLETGKENHRINHSVRKYILNEQNNKCSICGIDNIWNDKPLTFICDHINGDSTNNSRENLRLICSNCDSQLDTYKSKNKGNGRDYRRKRYTEGKSY